MDSGSDTGPDGGTDLDDDKVMYERLWDAVWIHPREVPLLIPPPNLH